MEQHENDGRDGLERFFHSKLDGYQDEPSDLLWQRISDGIPQKPKTNYRPILIWAGRSVAACLALVFTAALIQFRYDSQLDNMAAQLAKSQEELAALEKRLNTFQTVASAAPSLTEAAPHINQKPQTHNKQAATQVIYMPAPTEQPQRRVVEKSSPKQQMDKHTVVALDENKPQPNTNNHSSETVVTYRPTQFTISSFDPAKKAEILDLRKIQVPNHRKLNIPTTQFIAASDKFVMRHADMARVTSNTTSLGSGDFMPANLSLHKIKGMGRQLSVNDKVSVFMTPDYWNPTTQPRTLYSNANYSYPIGLESGVAYRF